jgi:hypothetical protein
MIVKNLLEIGIVFFGICFIIAASIYFISTIFKNQKIQGIISPFANWFKKKKISINALVQSIISILALLIALYALTMDSIRDNESSIRYSESVGREKSQHSEVMNIYQKQTKLTEKYSASADSMLETLRKQSQIADMQFENQIVLTQPGININFQIQDTKKTSLLFENQNMIMPEIILEMYNYGSRAADRVSLKVQIISPKAKIIHRFDNIENLRVLPKATLNQYFYPVVAIEDKSFFLIVIDITWSDVFNKNKVFKERLYNKIIREANDYYTSGKAEEIYIDLIKQIISKPHKVVTSNPDIRNYMYKVYNK